MGTLENHESQRSGAITVFFWGPHASYLFSRAPVSWEVPDCSERPHHWAPENRRGQASKPGWSLRQPLVVGPQDLHTFLLVSGSQSQMWTRGTWEQDNDADGDFGPPSC